jgi:NAD(P)-dependent dehydrogenase (short-subunit alcohol dehydrogenase family)
MTKRLEGRLALITGASRGLGAAVAKRFAAEGAHVILTARTVGGLEEVDDEIRSAGGEATLAPMDMFEADHLERMAASVHERFGKLDILVSAAAQLGVLTPVHHLDQKTWDRTLQLNLTCNQRLIRAYDPLLRLSSAGRALFVTCPVARTPKAFWGVYAASKAGLESLVQCYQLEVEKTALGIHLIDPGPMTTNLRAEAYPGEEKGTQPYPEDPAITDRFVEAAAVPILQ